MHLSTTPFSIVLIGQFPKKKNNNEVSRRLDKIMNGSRKEIVHKLGTYI